MEAKIKNKETAFRKSNRTLGMTASQITILLVLGCFALILFGALAGLILSNTNSLLNTAPVAPIGHPTNSAPTYAPQVSATVVDNYIVGIWQDNWIVPCIITLKKINGSYQMTRLYSDGSGETKTLTVQTVGGILRLIEYPDSPTGDYMVIENGNLVFYDNEGYIYEDYPTKLDTFVPTFTRTPEPTLKPTSTPTPMIIMLQGGDIGGQWEGSGRRIGLISVYRTDKVDGEKPYGESEGFTQFLVVKLRLGRIDSGYEDYDLSDFWMWAYTNSGDVEYLAEIHSPKTTRVYNGKDVEETIAYEIMPISHNFILCFQQGIGYNMNTDKWLIDCGDYAYQFKFGD